MLVAAAAVSLHTCRLQANLACLFLTEKAPQQRPRIAVCLPCWPPLKPAEPSRPAPQLMRLEFGAPSSSRPVSTFNFNYERQAALNAALLKGAAPDLPPSSRRAVRKVRRLVARVWFGQCRPKKGHRGGAGLIWSALSAHPSRRF